MEILELMKELSPPVLSPIDDLIYFYWLSYSLFAAFIIQPTFFLKQSYLLFLFSIYLHEIHLVQMPFIKVLSPLKMPLDLVRVHSF